MPRRRRAHHHRVLPRVRRRRGGRRRSPPTSRRAVGRGATPPSCAASVGSPAPSSPRSTSTACPSTSSARAACSTGPRWSTWWRGSSCWPTPRRRWRCCASCEGPRYRIGRRDLAALARHLHAMREAAGDDGERRPRPRRRPHRARRGRRPLRRGARAAAARSTTSAPRWRPPPFRLPGARPGRDDHPAHRAVAGLGPTGPREPAALPRPRRRASHPVEGDPGLPAFLEYLQLLDESEEDVAEFHASDDDAVKVMTIHQAKGLEFATVYVPGLAGQRTVVHLPRQPRRRQRAHHRGRAAVVAARGRRATSPTGSTCAAEREISDVLRARKLAEEWRLLLRGLHARQAAARLLGRPLVSRARPSPRDRRGSTSSSPRSPISSPSASATTRPRSTPRWRRASGRARRTPVGTLSR